MAGIAHCSLREAIAAANANADTNTINFATAIPGVMSGVTGTITLTNGQLTVTNSVNIVGPGAANLTVSGNYSSRVFAFSGLTAVLSGLTIADGRIVNTGEVGAGVENVAGWLTISECAVVRNTNAVISGNDGGGIYNSGTLNLTKSEISHNDAAYGGGVANQTGTVTALHILVRSNTGTGGAGGGIRNSSGIMRIVESTVSGNHNFDAGGISSFAGSLFLTNTTVSGNVAGVSGGGVRLSGSGTNVIIGSTISSNLSRGLVAGFPTSVSLGGSIIAGNGAGADCGGFIDSLDYNLILNTNGATITNLTAHNLYNQDPKLGPLADLGGPTPTHALRFDSPALDAGHSGGLTTDQRGLPRPIDDPNTPNAAGGDGSDIGAYEADPELRVTSIEKVGDDIRLRFNTLFGRTYAVESEDNLDDSWSPLTNNIPGTGGGFQALDASAANQPRRFYRGVMLLP